MDNTTRVTEYGLSSCVHCKLGKEFLEQNNIPVTFIVVDKMQGKERAAVLTDVKKINPKISFPTFVIEPEGKVIVGFVEEELKEALGI